MGDIDYSALVKHLRDALRLTQEQFAHKLDVTVGTVNGWENGRHRPLNAQRKRLVRMAEANKVPVPRRSDEEDPGDEGEASKRGLG